MTFIKGKRNLFVNYIYHVHRVLDLYQHFVSMLKLINYNYYVYLIWNKEKLRKRKKSNDLLILKKYTNENASKLIFLIIISNDYTVYDFQISTVQIFKDFSDVLNFIEILKKRKF